MDHIAYDTGAVQGLILGLQVLLKTQQDVTPKLDPQIFERPIDETTRTYILATIVELTELMDELDWKLWTPPQPLDKDKIADEFADILAFLGIIQWILYHRVGLTPYDLARAYKAKTIENADRAKKYGKQQPLGI